MVTNAYKWFMIKLHGGEAPFFDERKKTMKIKISSDSTCDLSKELIERYDIGLMPLTVVKGNETFRDGVDIFPTDIFDYVAGGGELCKTTAPAPAEFEDMFADYKKEFDAVIHISLGSGFSTSYQNAKIAAGDFENVYVVDSQNLSTGQGHLVLEAAKRAEAGMEPGEIVSELLDIVPRVETSFIIDSLQYLVKGGRCSSAAAFGANLLKIKPCIDLEDGKMTSGKKYRGPIAQCVGEYVKDKLKDRDDYIPERIFLTWTNHTPQSIDAARAAIKEYGHFEEVYETMAGCTISCHCGPRCLGVLFIRKK